MSSKLHFGQVVICCLGFTVPAVAQLDSYTLRAKFGAPRNRETFQMAAGFDLTVDYGASNQVCKFTVPALMPTTGKVSNTAEMKQRMYDFLLELAPGSVRGKELGRIASAMGTVSLSSIEYEHVIINELHHADQRSENNSITVIFKNYECENQAVRSSSHSWLPTEPSPDD